MKAIKQFNEISPVILSGIAGIIILAAIFFAVIPAINAVRRLGAAVRAENKTLSYVADYSKKIEFLKKHTKPDLTMPANKSAMKFLTSMLAFYEIKKPQTTKLTESFIGKNKANKTVSNKKITMILKGIALNQAIGIIYSISHSGYGISIVSARIKKNFRNKKLLNLSLVMNSGAASA
ncbi:MAG: hypothetical protein ACYCSQ_02315 [bacterium]